MRPATPGMHHVSAIAGDPQANLEFYTDVLGLRFVKRTVNFDEKFMYHLYYGNETGDPGTLLTFFPFQRGDEGRIGKPQPSAVALTIPRNSAGFWHDRLAEAGVAVEEPTERFGDRVVSLRDHDGTQVELIEGEGTISPWTGRVSAEYAIRGLHSVTLQSTSIFHTAATLEVLGYELTAQEGDRVRYEAPGSDANAIDILDAESEYGREGIGTIHHVAFRTGDTDLGTWRERLVDAGLEPTWIRDRRWFESIYFREPGGVLFELATDEPGMTVDEDMDVLGSSLQLPPQYEEDRAMIESQLPDLTLPEE